LICWCSLLFFFQAEDGIRDRNVTGVQTCALPIFDHAERGGVPLRRGRVVAELLVLLQHGGDIGDDQLPATCERSPDPLERGAPQIGRASCRERVWISAGAV